MKITLILLLFDYIKLLFVQASNRLQDKLIELQALVIVLWLLLAQFLSFHNSLYLRNKSNDLDFRPIRYRSYPYIVYIVLYRNLLIVPVHP